MAIYLGQARASAGEAVLVPSRSLRTSRRRDLSGAAIDVAVSGNGSAAFSRVVAMTFDEPGLPSVTAVPAAPDDSEYW